MKKKFIDTCLMYGGLLGIVTGLAEYLPRGIIVKYTPRGNVEWWVPLVLIGAGIACLTILFKRK